MSKKKRLGRDAAEALRQSRILREAWEFIDEHAIFSTEDRVAISFRNMSVDELREFMVGLMAIAGAYVATLAERAKCSREEVVTRMIDGYVKQEAEIA